MLFDATATQTYDAGLSLAAGNLNLSAAVVNLGDVPVGTPGLNLSAALLATFGSAKNLTLSSLGGIDVCGSATVGQLAAGGTPSLDQLTLVGPGSGIWCRRRQPASQCRPRAPGQFSRRPVANAGTGIGGLTVNAAATALDDGVVAVAGDIALSGFQAVAIDATGRASSAGGAAPQTVAGTGDLLFTGKPAASASMTLADAGASLVINAERITAQRGVNAAITVAGALSIQASGPTPDATQQTELGASLAITAQNLDLGGRIDLPAGVVQIATTGSASTDGITLDGGSSIRVAGLTQTFASTTADVSAGTVALSTASGAIAQSAGATIDLSGAGTQGDAGSLLLSAPTGTVTLDGSILAVAGSDAARARFSVDAGSIASLSTLARTFNLATGSAGASSISVRARNGDLTVQGNDVLRAANIVLEADGGGGSSDGSVNIAGNLDASGANGGKIAVYANDQILVQGGALIGAYAYPASGNGGEVTLSSRILTNPATSLDAVVLQSGALIDVAGGSAGTGGSVTLRAPRVGSDVAITAAAGTVMGSRALDGTIAHDAAQGVQASVIVDAVQVYAQPGNVTLDPGLATGLLATARTGAQNYMSSALTPGSGIDTTRLALDLNLRPGIEIDTPGLINVSYAKLAAPVAPVLDFAATNATGAYLWRYGGSTLATSTPGELTLRAAGGINVNISISDGFAATAPVATAPSATRPYTLNSALASSGESWSYTLTAGADLSASNPNQTAQGANQPGANLTIGTASAAKPVTIRTGTGSISLNASQDVVLNNGAGQQSNTVYTAGVANVIPLDANGNPLVFPTLKSTVGTTSYVVNVALSQYGGDLNIQAGRDVLGSAASNPDGSTQNVNEWLLHGGQATAAAPTVWWVDFAQFQQGFGALGGGDLTLDAGRDVARVGAVVASNGYDSGSGVSQRNFGSLNVTAGGTIQQGLYYDEAGTFNLTATALAANPNSVRDGNVRLAQGSNVINLQARQSAQFDSSFNPFQVDPGLVNVGNSSNRARNSAPLWHTQFSTFGAASALDARVAAGDIAIDAFGSINAATMSTLNSVNFNVTAPNLELVAFGGNLSAGNLILGTYPNSPQSSLIMAPSATGQLHLLADGSIQNMSVLMSQADPSLMPAVAAPIAFTDLTTGVITTIFKGSSGASLHALDPTTAEVVARTGSIADIYLDIPKTSEIAAGAQIGGDAALPTIIDVQNSSADSLSRVSAGKDVVFINGNPFEGVAVSGPGALQVVSGGAINLGSGGLGIVSRGNLDNSNLDPVGASLLVVAGAGRGANGLAATPDYAGSISNFVTYDVFASSGAAAATLDAQVLAALGKDPSMAPLVAALQSALAARAADPAATATAVAVLQQQLAGLAPAVVAEGAVKLASAIQVVNNQLFVQSGNSDTFAPAYAAFYDLFPNLNNNAAAVRQFVLANVFANASNGADLRSQALQGLPAALDSVIAQGLADPAAVKDPASAFSTALAALDPAVLAAGSRQLLANVLSVAGSSRDALQAAGRLTGSGSPYAKELTAFAQAFSPAAAAGLNDLQMDYNQIKTEQTGSVAFFAPQGSVIVGQSSPPTFTAAKTPDQLGIFTYGGGDIIGMSRDNIDVFGSRVFTVAGGDIDLWSSLGNLDAGKGPRDVAVVPPPRLVVDANGVEQLDLSASVSGSGIGALVTQANQPPSDINLMAPAGYVDAGEAGIRAQSGTVTLGTNLVLNAGNIQAASGVSGGAVVATHRHRCRLRPAAARRPGHRRGAARGDGAAAGRRSFRQPAAHAHHRRIHRL